MLSVIAIAILLVSGRLGGKVVYLAAAGVGAEGMTPEKRIETEPREPHA